MADLKLLVPELNEAEEMGADTARFQELLLQVRIGQDSCVPGYLGDSFFFFYSLRWACSSQNALERQQGLWEL